MCDELKQCWFFVLANLCKIKKIQKNKARVVEITVVGVLFVFYVGIVWATQPTILKPRPNSDALGGLRIPMPT